MPDPTMTPTRSGSAFVPMSRPASWMRFLRRCHGELHETVHPPRFFPIYIILRIKIFHFCCDSCRQFTGIERRDRRYAGFALNQIRP